MVYKNINITLQRTGVRKEFHIEIPSLLNVQKPWLASFDTELSKLITPGTLNHY